jgi:hypothetical protein
LDAWQVGHEVSFARTKVHLHRHHSFHLHGILQPEPVPPIPTSSDSYMRNSMSSVCALADQALYYITALTRPSTLLHNKGPSTLLHYSSYTKLSSTLLQTKHFITLQLLHDQALYYIIKDQALYYITALTRAQRIHGPASDQAMYALEGLRSSPALQPDPPTRRIPRFRVYPQASPLFTFCPAQWRR